MFDYFGKNTDCLNDKKLFLFDMDGTIYCENDLFDGVIELLETIKKKGGRYAFITNNPSKSVQDYVKKLFNMGIKDVCEDDFFTSAQAAVAVMKEKFGNGLIYTQGTTSYIEGLKKSGLNITQEYTKTASAVLVSFDPELTGEKLRTTCKMLTHFDIPYYATNPDWVCPVDFGYIPDCGSMCFGIEKATGKRPVYIGKPEPMMIFTLMKKFGYEKNEVVVVGDRLYTDIASGVNAGVDTICVLSGEATLSDIENAEQKPTFVLKSIKDIVLRQT